MSVQTVRGPVAAETLGPTLMHEHIFGLSAEVLWNWPDLPEGWDLEKRAAEAAGKLNELKAAGIDTIVDLTVIGLGRYLPAVQRVAERTDITIVAATGVYTYDALPGYFANKGPGTLFGGPDRLLEMMLRDITEGIGRTGVRAGVIKCSTGHHGATSGTDRLLRTAARAHRETGVPISTHSESAVRGGLEQQRIFAEEGVDLGRVVIGHAGDSTDLDYLEELVAAGSFIGMDRFGIEFTSFEDRVATVAALCERGHAGSMVLSHDSYCFNDRIDPVVVAEQHPNYHLMHISRDVLPALRERGVTEDQIHRMLVDNPREILERGEPY